MGTLETASARCNIVYEIKLKMFSLTYVSVFLKERSEFVRGGTVGDVVNLEGDHVRCVGRTPTHDPTLLLEGFGEFWKGVSPTNDLALILEGAVNWLVLEKAKGYLICN